MSIGRQTKSTGGQGGRRGHSNMCHWSPTEEIKRMSKKKRRLEAKKEIRHHDKP